MKEYLFLMRDDAPPGAERYQDWASYLGGLEARGCLQGGSSLAAGGVYAKEGHPTARVPALSGYILVRAPDLSAARELLAGNPVFEAGGSVEIHERVPDGDGNP